MPWVGVEDHHEEETEQRDDPPDLAEHPAEHDPNGERHRDRTRRRGQALGRELVHVRRMSSPELSEKGLSAVILGA